MSDFVKVCRDSRDDLVDSMIAKQAEVAVKRATRELLDSRNENGDSGLHVATKENHPMLIKKLLSLGANVDIQNYSNKTPLHVAITAENYYIVKILLDAGASTTISDGKARMPIDMVNEDYVDDEIADLVKEAHRRE